MKGQIMEISSNAIKQQNTQVHTAQQNTETKPVHKQEVKAPLAERIAQAEQKAQHSETDARDLIDTLNKALDPFNTSIKFGFDNSNDVFFVSVIDTHTNDTIRRFPVEQAGSLVSKMNEIVGIIFDEKG